MKRAQTGRSDTGFVLLAGSQGIAWREAALALAARWDLALTAYCVGPQGDLRAPANDFQERAEISAEGALLVRPDGFVAWRTTLAGADAEQQLEGVLKQVLAR